jgi:hypothetical protein
MILSRRHQEGRVVEAGLRRIVRPGVGPVLDLDQRRGADAKPSQPRRSLQHTQAEQIAVEIREPVEVARNQPDRADMQRRAAGESGRGRGVGCVHGNLYRRLP